MQMIQFQINHRRAFSLIQAKVNFKNNTKNKKEEKKEKENTSSVELLSSKSEWINKHLKHQNQCWSNTKFQLQPQKKKR